MDAFYCLAGAIGFGTVSYTFLRVVIDINHAWRLSLHISSKFEIELVDIHLIVDLSLTPQTSIPCLKLSL
jgi:hypothetical protein